MLPGRPCREPSSPGPWPRAEPAASPAQLTAGSAIRTGDGTTTAPGRQNVPPQEESHAPLPNVPPPRRRPRLPPRRSCPVPCRRSPRAMGLRPGGHVRDHALGGFGGLGRRPALHRGPSRRPPGRRGRPLHDRAGAGGVRGALQPRAPPVLVPARAGAGRGAGRGHPAGVSRRPAARRRCGRAARQRVVPPAGGDPLDRRARVPAPRHALGHGVAARAAALRGRGRGGGDGAGAGERRAGAPALRARHGLRRTVGPSLAAALPPDDGMARGAFGLRGAGGRGGRSSACAST